MSTKINIAKLVTELKSDCQKQKQVTVIDLVRLGSKMRSMRIRHNLSLRKVAEDMALSPSFLSDCELGRRKLSDEDLECFVTIVSTS